MHLTTSHDQTPPVDSASPGAAASAAPHLVRVLAVAAVAQYHGVELDPQDLGPRPGTAPTTADLLAWARSAGLQARSRRLNWRRLMKAGAAGPVVLLLNDGTAAVMMRADRARNIVWLRDPTIPRDQDGVP